MRLINAETLEFAEFAKVHFCRPPYYILSHRWQEDEISYRDFKKRRRTDSQGYQKVLDFCKFAKTRHEKNREEWRHWYHIRLSENPCYIWIDTCCIDKSSSAELSLSINSMWAWYRRAIECHIYLSDVHASERGPKVNEELRASSWFRRGWTLQELLAPVGSCERLLLNSKWEVMGGIPSSSGTGPYLGDYDVDSLLSVVSEITGIQEDYLTGSRSIEEASVACRMSWSSNRSATLTEDEAYCLMGIFNVNMPLLYGEGHGAFRRLQEEIIRTSTDQSIFASSYERFLSALDPSDFAGSGNVVTRSHESHRVVKHMPIQPFEMTNLGVRFRAAIRRGRLHGQYQGFRAFQLNCFEMSGAEDTLTPIYLAL